MRPYKASNDITKDCWYGMFFWAGAWLTVCDEDARPIRFATWRDAKHAAKLEHGLRRPSHDAAAI